MLSPRILVALPSYTPGQVCVRALLEAQRAHPDWPLSIVEKSWSSLTENFNACWADCLNLRSRAGFTHFLMLHADVRPVHPDWLGVLMAEMARTQADILSVIIPIKSDTGDPTTSTALESDDPWHPVRLTQREAMKLDPTWTHPRLLVNTGCLLVNIGDWMREVYFRFDNRIRQGQDGLYRAEFLPEDWLFSRDCRQLGLKLFATRAIGVEHVGSKTWARA